jgi:peptidoglycan/LPS O-acetylase OafA/YrhL
MLCSPYLLMYLAFTPKGKSLAYNKVGDYSYGVYVFAWPIQQSIIEIYRNIDLLQHIALSTLCTLIIAIPCFHYIEAPTMRSRRSIVAAIKYNFSKIRSS